MNGSGTVVNATGTTISVTGTDAFGVTIAGGGTLNLTNATITTSAASGIQMRDATSTLNLTGNTTVINASGADAILINGSRNVTIGDGVSINAMSSARNVVYVTGGGRATVGAANITAREGSSAGLTASGTNSQINATGTIITMSKGNSVGVDATSSGSVSLTDVKISGSDASSSGIRLRGAATLTMNTATSIKLSGDSSYGLAALSGNTSTFTGTNAVAGTIWVTGQNSAALEADGTNSKLTFVNVDFTAKDIRLGENSSTFLAKNGGAISLEGTTNANNTTINVGQSNSTIYLKGGTTATGATVITTGTFDIQNITDKDNFSIGSLSGDGSVTMGGTRLTVNGSASTTFSGVISGTNGFRYAGTGTLTLSGANTFTGNIGLISGTVATSSDSALGASTGGINFNGGTLKVMGTTYTSTSRSMTWNAGGGGFNIDSASNTFTVSQNLGTSTTPGGALTKSGAGTLVLSGTNLYTGGTNINGGTLSVSSDSNLGATSGALNFNGGTLHLSGSFTSARAVTLGASGGTLYISSGSSVFSGAITDAVTGTAGALTKTGAGNLVLTGDDTATGTMTVAAGTLQIGNGGSSGSIASNIANSGRVSFYRAGTLTYGGVISGSGTVNKGSTGTVIWTGNNTYTGATTIASGTLQIGNGGTTGWLASTSITDDGTLSFNRSDAKTYSGNIGGDGSVVKAGSGTLILSGTNTYKGGTTISAGTLQVASDAKLGDATGTVTLDGGTLSLAGTITSARSYGITNRNGTIDTGTNTDTISGVISDKVANEAGALTKTGTGTLVLTGANTYSGGTTISGGVLQIGNGGEAGSITGNVANSGTLTFNRSNTLTYGGVISGTGVLKQSGTGRTILTGANTYTGNTVIEGGVLQVGNDGTSGAISGTVTNSGTLEFKRSDSYTYAGTVSGTGALQQTGSGTLILTGDNTYTGLTTITSGTLQVGAGGTVGSLSGDIENDSALVMNRSDDLTYSKSISGSGTFEKRGAGKLTLTGDSDYTGTTTITAGTLEIGAGGATGSIDSDIANSGALVFNRSNDIDFTKVLSGSGSLEKKGAGNLVLSGDSSTFAGTTTVSAGGLVVDGTLGFAAVDDVPGSGNVTVASGAWLGGDGYIGGNTTISNGGALEGTQGDTLTFGGNLTLATGAVVNVSYGAPDADVGSLFSVHGDLTLNSNTVNIASLGGFGPGQYKLFNSSGTISGASGLTAGTLPDGVQAIDISFNTSGNDVYITNAQGMSLTYWDGSVVSESTDLTGGSGTWSATTTNWTGNNGGLHGGWNSARFAIFAGDTGGTVTVDATDGAISTLGMQFETTGYTVTGDGLTLVSSSEAAPIIRVGSATTPNTTATISSVLSGTKGMEKTDLGTLILAGTNTYTGTTTVQAGTLQLGNGGATGSVDGNIVLGKTGEKYAVTLAVDHTDAFTLSNSISGRGKLVQRGSGSTTLSGTNTYSGGTDILGGSLIVSADSKLGDAAGSVTINGGTLQFSADLSSTRGYTIGANGGTINTGTYTDTITGVIGGTGQFNKTGTGTLILGGDNTFTGNLHVNAGTLQISDNSNLGNPDSHLYVNAATLKFGDDFTMTHDLTLGGTGATIDVGADGSNTISGVIDGSKLTKTGGGTLLLTGTNTYTGDTEIDGGVLAVKADANFGATVNPGSIIIGNATLLLDGDFTTARNIHLTDNNSTIDVVDDGVNTLDGVLSGTGALNKSGTGTLVLGGTNTYEGGTDIKSGILQISKDGNLGKSGVAVVIGAGAELQFSDAVTSDRNITLGTTGSIIDTVKDTSTLSGVISGGELHKTGAGTLVLSGTNTYDGGTFLEGGVIQVNADDNLGKSTGALTFDGGTLQLGATLATARTMTINEAGGTIDTQSYTATLSGSLSGDGGLTKLGTGTLVLTNSANAYKGGTSIEGGTLRLGGAGWITGNVANKGTLEFASNTNHDFSGVISGTGSVVQSGTNSTITLSGTNTYSGGTSITAGTLAISKDENLGSGDLTIANNSILQLTDSFAFSHAIALDTGGTVDTGANTDTIAGVISGDGGLTKTGSGKLILSGTNTYSDGTTIAAGSLQIEKDSNLGAATGSVTMADGTTLELTSDVTMDRAFTLSGSATFQADDRTSHITGVISGDGGLTKSGEGVLVLEGANTYKGGTTFNGGVLSVGSDGNLGDSSGSLTFNGGELQTTGSFTSDRNVTLQGTGGIIDTLLNSPELSGDITGAGKLTKIGEGKLTLSGDGNTYSGETVVSQGTLQIGGADGKHGSIAGDIKNDGTVVFHRDTLVYAGSLEGSGKLEQAGVGKTTLTGSVDLAGGATIDSGGTLQVGDGTTNGSIKGAVTNNGTFTFDAVKGTNISFDDVLSGNGVLNILGPSDDPDISKGSVTMTGDSSGFAGTTNVNTGTLYVNGTLGSDQSTVNVAAEGELSGDGTIGGATTISGALIGQDGKTLTFSSGLTMQSGSTINVSYGKPNENGLFDVKGALSLKGSTVNIADFGGFGPGVYHLFDYHDTLTKTGPALTIGTVPGGSSSDAYVIYDDANKQINIMNAAGAKLNTWNGGNGEWNLTNQTSWKDPETGVTGSWKNSEFAIFDGPSATVTMGTGVIALGMQFNADGYVLSGTNPLTLFQDQAGSSTDKPIIRVGTATDEDGKVTPYTATISAPLAGTQGLQKTDYGTLVLKGTNTYTGGTDVLQGTLALGDGGTITTADGVSVDAAGADKATFAIDKTSTFSFDGVISGAGQFAQTGTGKTTLTATNTYSGGTLISAGTLSVGAEGNLGNVVGQVTINGGTLEYSQGFTTSRAIALGAGNGTIQTDDTTNAMVIDSAISGAGGLTKSGAGTLVLTKNNTYSGGTTITGGTLQLGNGEATGKIGGDVNTGADADHKGTLVFDMSGDPVFAKTISGAGNVVQSGSDKLTLSGTNTYTGGTTIDSGTLAVSADANMGDDSGSLTIGNGTLQNTAKFTMNRAVVLDNDHAAFQNDADLTLAGSMSGSTAWSKTGSGKLIIAGDASAATGTASINNGYLQVNGELGGNVNLASGTAAIGGAGTIDGNVSVGSGTLYGQGGQTLTIGGDLTLASNSTTSVQWGSATKTPAFQVNGNLTLAGTLNITDAGGFGPGVYRLANYNGLLTDNGLQFGTVPGGDQAKDRMSIQTSYDNQVNVVNTYGAVVKFWDGGYTQDDLDNNKITGGSGVWKADNQNWTDDQARVLAAFDQGEFAVFGGEKGNVTVDDSAGQINAAGMQFATDGYVLNGGSVNLSSTTGVPIIRVGDGTADGATMTATIGSTLTGSQGLNKTDSGTLILTGQNAYTGGTTVSDGTLQLGDGTTSGSIKGDVTVVRDANGEGTLAFNQAAGSDTAFSGNISGGGQVVQNGANTLTLSGNNTFSGGTTVNNGTLKAGSDNAFGTGSLTVGANGNVDFGATNNTVGVLSGTGAINIGAGTFTVNEVADSTYGGTMSGTGSFVKSGAADLTLTGSNQYTGATTVNQGTLTQGSQGALSSASAYTVARNGTLDIGGYDTTVASLDNAGTVNLSDMTAGTTLNVAGNFTGSNGTVVINTVLGDDTSKTDRLNVKGDTSGTTTLQVVNRGGLGAQTTNGIQVVNVSGQSNGTFNLQGDFVTKDGQQAVIGGAYAYTLQKNGVTTPNDGDWYLRSALKDGSGPNPDPTPLYNPGVPVYEAYVQTLQALNRLPTLQQRVGDRYWSEVDNNKRGDRVVANPTQMTPQAIWGRIEGAHNSFQPSTTTGRTQQDVNTYLLQAGVDGKFYEDDNGMLIGSFTGQYGTARGDVSSVQGDGYINTNGYALGGTLTWYGDNGFYVDAQTQATWFSSDLNSRTANTGLATGRNAFGFAMSVEGGQRIAVDENWTLTPQAQLSWSSIDFNSYHDAFDAKVGLEDGSSLIGRIGLAANYNRSWMGDDGRMVNTSVYGIANLYQEFLGGTRINVSGVDFSTDNDRTWGGIGAGGTYMWAGQKYSIYGEGSINTSLNHFADSYVLKGSAGFRMKW
ncbi:autotransporter-associated beta strand repeat-containing protein [Ochrobactrum sp. CGA5]|uniref:autotransporter-associated beta strand repeat-containing protein n=1 Tax=Ochrobactrum sp. CGA5 TaxID=2583453 RepID=UPI001120E775|nr:autotransporter-associated beta strand repeat-containing protein [Ochrobactrum sp. CGA5]